MKVTEDNVWYIWNIMVDDHEHMNKTEYHDDDDHEIRSSEGKKADVVMNFIESLIDEHFKKAWMIPK